jgi:hypothetical protein
MEIAVVEDHVVEAELGALRVDVHLPDRLAMVAVLGQNLRQGPFVPPRDSVLVADASAALRRTAGEKGARARDAGGTRRKGRVEVCAADGQLIQIWRMHVRMSGDAEDSRRAIDRRIASRC